MNPPEPVLPDPDSPVESPSNPVEEPPVVDDIAPYKVGSDSVDDAGSYEVGGDRVHDVGSYEASGDRVHDVGSYEVGGNRVDDVGFPPVSILGVANALEVGAVAVWVGASAGFAFISAPLAFRLVTDRDVFAELTERTLARLANLTYVAGGVAVGLALIRAASDRDDRWNDALRGVAGCTALACITYHQRAIVPAMTRAKAAMGGTFAGVAEEDPQRIVYRALHRRSTRTYGTALLLGIAELALAAI